MGERKDGLDGVAGILLVYMMFTHVMQRCGLTGSATYGFLQPVLFFFMPWFFFKGGRFVRERTLGEEWQSVWKRLLRPFLVFSALGWIVDILVFMLQGEASWRNCLRTPLNTLFVSGSVPGNLPLWFLPVLAAVRLVHCAASRVKIPGVVLAPAALGAAWLLSRFLPYPTYLGSMAAGLCFFTCGSLLGRHSGKWPVWLVALAVYLAIYFLCPSWVDMRTNQLRSGFYPVFYLSSLAGILVVDGMAEAWERLEWPRLLFCRIGRHAMAYFCWHWILLSLGLYILGHLCGLPAETMAWILGAVVLVMPALLSRWTGKL